MADIEHYKYLMESYQPNEMNAGLIGIGTFGQLVLGQIKDVVVRYEGTLNRIWNHFDVIGSIEEIPPDNEYHLLFIACSIKDIGSALKTSRDLNSYFTAILIDDTGGWGNNAIADLSPKESLVVLPDNTPEITASHIIEDLYSTFSVPPLIGIDLADIRVGMGGGMCTGLSAEGSDIHPFIYKNQTLIQNSGSVTFIHSYDFEQHFTLDAMTEFGDLIHNYASEEAVVDWTVTSIQSVSKGQRGTLLIRQ